VAALLRVSIQGVMPQGEVWSVNPIYQLSAPSDPDFTELTAALAAANGVSVPAGLLATLNSNCQVTGMRIEAREANGTLTGVVEGPRAVAQTGSGSSVHPYQTSIVCSLRTEAPGASGRGRLYWPATGAALTPSTMRITASVRDAFNSAMSTYLSGIATAIETVIPDITLAVWSRSTGAINPVTRMIAGDVADTQRRRRDALAESYNVITYP